MTVRVLQGHVLDVLRSLPDNTFQCVATSPPYYGLRDYGLPPQVWESTSPKRVCTCGRKDFCTSWCGTEHAHEWTAVIKPAANGIVTGALQGKTLNGTSGTRKPPTSGLCACGAWLGSLGLEPTPELFVEHLVSVFREVRRVLRPDGVCWVNLGDSYAGSGKGPSNSLHLSNPHAHLAAEAMKLQRIGPQEHTIGQGRVPGCKPKDLLGIPWMVAFALRADGWYLRADIIWSKPNPMPESVTDRPTKAHEYVFLFSKSRTYFYDADAVREPATYAGKIVTLGEKSLSRGQAAGAGIAPSGNGKAESVVVADGRNRRSVWEIATAPFPEAHFATFPPKLVEPMLLAGSRPGDHVLDPFGGAGTTALVADRLGRDCTLIELNPAYASMARERITDDAPLFAEVVA